MSEKEVIPFPRNFNSCWSYSTVNVCVCAMGDSASSCGTKFSTFGCG